MVKVAVIVFSAYEHILEMAKAEVSGLKSAGVEVDLLQIPSGDAKDASSAAGLPLATADGLVSYDGFLFGLPSRFGTFPYAFKELFDHTGKQWAQGAYSGKFAGIFVSTGASGGGQETIARNSLSTFVHHGIIFVPIGYGAFGNELTNLSEVHGGSPWGAGTFAGTDGKRTPSQLELSVAEAQGKSFGAVVSKAIGNASKEEKDAGTSVSAEAGVSSMPTSREGTSMEDSSNERKNPEPTPTKLETSVKGDQSSTPNESKEKKTADSKCGCCSVM